MRLNKKAFDKVLFRPRVMRNIKHVDTRTKILGFDTGVPFFVAPTAMQGMINPDGEKAVTKGVGEENVIHIVSPSSPLLLGTMARGGRRYQQTHSTQ
jgi:L-lactate dehydrogenase (cytochrome)